MDKNKTVSVIVPIYNMRKYLPACIESILGQTYQDLEVLLVDDGSVDDSLQICRKYAQEDDRIIVLTKENGGQGSARNMALDIMTGAYISFVDADDRIKPQMLEDMVGQLEEQEADLALCYIQTIDQKGRENARPDHSPEVYSNTELMREYLVTTKVDSGPCNKVYRSFLFADIRFPEIRAAEDYYIMHELLGKCSKAVHLGRSLYVQNLRSDSTERRPFTRENLHVLTCADRLYDYYKAHYPQLLPLVAFKKANKLAMLMCRILVTRVYRKNKAIYADLERQLHQEYYSALERYPLNPNVTKMTVEAVKHPMRFRLLNMLRGVKAMLR